MKAAFLTGINHYSFRIGQSSVIIGVKYLRPKGESLRPCYEIVYPDGKIDYVPISEVENGNYEMSSNPKN